GGCEARAIRRGGACDDDSTASGSGRSGGGSVGGWAAGLWANTWAAGGPQSGGKVIATVASLAVALRDQLSATITGSPQPGHTAFRAHRQSIALEGPSPVS